MSKASIGSDITRDRSRPLDLRPKQSEVRDAPPKVESAIRERPGLRPPLATTAPRRLPAQPDRLLPPAAVARPKKGRLKTMGTNGLIVIAAVGLGLASIDTQIGQWVILAFGLSAITFKLSSRISFGLALAVLVMVPVFTTIQQKALAENYAVYTYYLLVIGVVTAAIELYRERPARDS